MLLKLGGLFFIASLLFWLWAIFDSITAEPGRIRNLPKIAWVIVILIFLEFGALAWVLFGRPRNTPHATSARGAGNRPAGPRGPDDDPDFLKGL